MPKLQHRHAHRCQSRENSPFVEIINALHRCMLVATGVADGLGTVEAGGWLCRDRKPLACFPEAEKLPHASARCALGHSSAFHCGF